MTKPLHIGRITKIYSILISLSNKTNLENTVENLEKLDEIHSLITEDYRLVRYRIYIEQLHKNQYTGGNMHEDKLPLGIPRGIKGEDQLVLHIPGHGEETYSLNQLDLLFLELIDKPTPHMPEEEDTLYIVGKTLYLIRNQRIYVLAYAYTKGSGKAKFENLDGTYETLDNSKIYTRVLEVYI